MSEVPLPVYTIDLISQYLARATALTPASPAGDYIEANRLAIHLAILLPAALFRTVRDGAEASDPLALMRCILDVRAIVQSAGSLDLTDSFYHAPLPDLQRMIN
jgi:hypothetical protein